MRRWSGIVLAAFASSSLTACWLCIAPEPAAADTTPPFVFPYQDKSIVDPPGRWTQDAGVDIADRGTCGSDAVLVAVSDGVVAEVTDPDVDGFGPYLPVILASDGPFAGRLIYYGHTETPLVTAGQHVTAGQPVAHVGCGQVGISDGPHLEIGVSTPGGPVLPGWGTTSREMLEQLVAAYEAPDPPPAPTPKPDVVDTGDEVNARVAAPYQVAGPALLDLLGAPSTSPAPARAPGWSNLKLF